MNNKYLPVAVAATMNVTMAADLAAPMQTTAVILAAAMPAALATAAVVVSAAAALAGFGGLLSS